MNNKQIHKLNKLKRSGSCGISKSETCLGEKHRFPSKKSKMNFTLGDSRNTLGINLVEELRKRNPYSHFDKNQCACCSWKLCIDELEKMLKEEK